MFSHKGARFTNKICISGGQRFANNDTTPSVLGHNHYLCANGHTAARNITMLDDGTSGQIVIIIGGNPTYKTTIKDGTNMYLVGDWVEALHSTLTLIYYGGAWYELARTAPG